MVGMSLRLLFDKLSVDNTSNPSIKVGKSPSIPTPLKLTEDTRFPDWSKARFDQS